MRLNAVEAPGFASVTVTYFSILAHLHRTAKPDDVETSVYHIQMSRLSLDQIPAGSTSESNCLRRVMAEEIEDLTRATFWRACAGEFLGTMILTMFAVGYGLHFPEQNGLSGLQAAIGVGLLLSTVIMLFSTVSGGHVNPVVSIGFAVVREISLVRFLLYCVSQCAGAIVGAGILKLIMPEAMHHNSGVIVPHDDVTDAQALITEMIISFNLVFGVFALTDRGRKDIAGSVPIGVGIIVCINILFAVSFFNFHPNKLFETC